MRDINAVKFYPRVMCIDPAGDIIRQNLPTSTVYAIAAMMDGKYSIDFFETAERPLHVVEDEYAGYGDYADIDEFYKRCSALEQDGWIYYDDDDYMAYIRELKEECVPYRWIKSCPVDSVSDWWKGHVMLIDEYTFGEEFRDALRSDRTNNKYILEEYGHLIEWMAKYEGNTRRLNEENAREYSRSTRVVDTEE